ncbi:uncharacterized protein LOC143614087 [Bidens hawaiensis]|uniref:uncharacterized protein LOC143614087 n=1 Tax=Bidens hawaiensis TaxID=980011 RepID=UPI00404B3396
MAGRLEEGNRWVVDSGFTEHITHSFESFLGNIESSQELPVTIPNGESVPVKGKGLCVLPNDIKIRDVLYVPEFTCNLLSVSRLTQDLRCAVTFFPDFFVMQDLSSRKLIGTGKCQQGLYRMRMVGNKRMAMAFTNNMWHQRLGHASHTFLAAIGSNDEPKTFNEAIHDVNWREAMKKEIPALELNGTWSLEELPEGKRAIGSKWGKENKVCRLKKSLYGLKQASRNWYQKFTSSLQQIGFKQSGADHSLLIFKTESSFVAALIYVDDVILVGNDMEKIKETKTFLDKKFSIKDLGLLKYLLGIEVTRTREGIVLNQRKYILDILEDSGMTGC